jgi:CRISPR/Cas system CMR-associated protein Cmr3 (group 5 of RAMP superfamily)
MGEVLAPDGYRFIDGCHAMMVWDDAEKAELMSPEALEICPQDCDCKE